MYKPKVLIILAAYNGESWLDRQLRSLLNQEDVAVDIVIGDDNSNDGTQEILQCFAKDNSNIKLIFRKIGTGSAGGNFLSLIRDCDCHGYDFVSFSDQDDVWLPNKLSAGIGCLDGSNAAAYSSSALAFWASGDERLLKQSKKLRCADFLFEGAGQGCTFILQRNFFLKLQLFCRANRELTENFYYHDWLIYLLARAWELEWIFDSNSFIRYRQHGLNDTGARRGLGSVAHRVKLISNGWYKTQIGFAIRIANSSSINRLHLPYISDLFFRKDSLGRRIQLARYVYLNGRRRLGDRIVLVVSAILGWI